MLSTIIFKLKWSHDWDLNPRPLPYHGSALPLSYRGEVVRGVGFEPTNSERADLQSAVFDRFTNPAR